MARRPTMARETAIILAVVTAGVGFLIGRMSVTPASSDVAATSTAEAEAEIAPVPVAKYEEKQTVAIASPSKGAKSPLVVVHEVSDFQCPYCGRAATGIVDKIKQTWPDDVSVVFKHNALSFHKDARLAAIASIAASRQGKFWEYHDILFANMKALKRPQLIEYAQRLGLDMTKFKADLDNKDVAAKADNDQRAAVQLGATGTPSFFVNGRKVKQPKWDEVKKEIEGDLAKAKKMEADGVARDKVPYKLMAASGANATKFIKYFVNEERAPEAPKKNAKKKKGDTKTVWKVPVDPEKDAIKGPVDAEISIVEYSDFQCPFCGRIGATLTKVKDAYPGKVRIVFKHFPLGFHKEAPLASEAALAARAQGKFWEYHDVLFKNMKALKRPDLDRYAEEMKLDMVAFKKALDERTYKAQVDADMASGATVKVSGTPSVFINGRKLDGREEADFKAIIDEELKKTKKLLDSGTKPSELYDTLIAKGKVYTPPAPLEATVNRIKTGGNTSKGPDNAPIKIVEYSDFECPYCSRMVDPIHQLVAKYPTQIQVTFKQFPLSFHKNAQKAAEASLAAAEQGKFWEYHDLLFQNLKALQEDKLILYAGQVGLNVETFTAALKSGKYAAAVKAEMAEGQSIGVRGTPSFYVNGRKYNGGRDLAGFEKVFSEQLGLKLKK